MEWHEKKLTYVYAGIMLVYIITAINSYGYHHPDEHFQIIEFAGLKGGWNTGNDLAWEYDAQIRPILQPMIALSLFNFSKLIGVESPFDLAMILRLLTAAFSLICITAFIQSIRSSIKPEYLIVLIITSFLLWFLPAINIRFSSETWAGLTMLLSVALINRAETKKTIHFFIIGLLWGLTFEFRFQMAIILCSVFLWLILIKKETWKNLAFILSGLVLIILACTLLDSWFYGNWVFTPWNYFYTTIINSDPDQFGTSPWYFYIEQLFNRPTPLIGFILLFSIITLTIFKPKYITIWCIIPFIFIHSLIPHKELRFLFPIVNFFPLIVVLAYQEVVKRIKNRTIIQVIVYSIILPVNLFGLVMLSFRPASNGNINMLQHIYNKYDKVNLYTVAQSNPYTINKWVKGLTPRFYANNNVTIKKFSESLDFSKFGDNDLVISYKFHQKDYFLKNEGFIVEKKSVPEWIKILDRFYKVYPAYDSFFVLYSKLKIE